MQHRPVETLVRKSAKIVVKEPAMTKYRPKCTWIEALKDMVFVSVTGDIVRNITD